MKRNQTAERRQLATRWNEALANPAFSSKGLTLRDLAQVLPSARQRSFQRLIQSLFRERLIDAKACEHDALSGSWLTLDNGSRLRLGHLIAGGMSSWQLTGEVQLHQAGHPPCPIEFPSEMLQLLSEKLDPPASPDAVQRLSQELDDSLINDTLCLAFHDNWTRRLQEQTEGAGAINLLAWLKDQPPASNPTLLLEQWGTLGHPWHPNYKTKLGLSTNQLLAFSPEFEASFPVMLCALHRQYAHIETLPDTPEQWAWWKHYFAPAISKLIAQLRRQGLDDRDYIPLPVHPWQLEEQLPQLFANEIGDRLLVLTSIVAFNGHPTMSFRTVVPNASGCAPMIKLPVALHMTSAQRTVSPSSVRMGPRVSRLLKKILDREPELRSRMSIVPERIGIHYQPHPADDERARHLSALYRDNPSALLHHGEVAVPVGSLFAHDLQRRPLLREWVMLAQGRDDAESAQTFLHKYLAIAVPGLLGIYLLYGVAFEAHQQNSFMVMSPDGQPNRLLLRDFGDIRIDRATVSGQGMDIDLYNLRKPLYDDSELVRDKLLHSTFMCHLGELVLVFAHHWAIPQDQLWQVLGAHVTQCFDALRDRVEPVRWEVERLAILESPWPAKSLTRMSLQGSHTDIVGRLDNPLRATSHVC